MRIASVGQQPTHDINALIARSKAYWDWPPGYLAAALPLMEITPSYLRDNLCFEIFDADALVGFVSLVQKPDRRILDNLWIDPSHIGRGFGRFACEHIFDLARQKAWTDLTTLPDPPAEEFYRRMGFEDTGERTPSRVPGGPVFSVFKKIFDFGQHPPIPRKP
jgi:GNAT superfamily N-acetyltransferase